MPKILIVDDSRDLADFLTVLLQLHNFEVETALSKTVLMDKLDTFKPDLILLDIVLRHIDGRELCKEIKNNSLYKKIPIILLSANPEFLKGYEVCEANDVIEKPFDIKTVIDKINMHIHIVSPIEI
jgi:DNA-binding response OmpR family regulator